MELALIAIPHLHQHLRNPNRRACHAGTKAEIFFNLMVYCCNDSQKSRGFDGYASIEVIENLSCRVHNGIRSLYFLVCLITSISPLNRRPLVPRIIPSFVHELLALFRLLIDFLVIN